MREPSRPTFRALDTASKTRLAVKKTSLGMWILVTLLLLPAALSFIALALVILGYDSIVYAARDGVKPFLPVFVALIGVAIANWFSFDVTAKKALTSMLDFMLAIAYLTAWLKPALWGESRLLYFVWLIPVELMAIIFVLGITMWTHAETRRERWKVATLILLLVAASVNISYRIGHWWPFLAVTVVGANHALSLLWSRTVDGETDHAYPPWLFRCFLVVLLPGVLDLLPMPPLGWTGFRLPSFDESVYFDIVRAVSPHQILSFGFFYFLWSGLYELTGIPEWKKPPGRAGRKGWS